MYFSLTFTLVLQYVRCIKRRRDAPKQRLDIRRFQKDRVRKKKEREKKKECSASVVSAGLFSPAGANSICVTTGMSSHVSKCCSRSASRGREEVEVGRQVAREGGEEEEGTLSELRSVFIKVA